MVGQAQVIPKHVTRADWFQPLPELITWKEYPYRKEGFQKKAKYVRQAKTEDFYHRHALSLQLRLLSLEKPFHLPKNTQEESHGAGVLFDSRVLVP